MKINGVFLIFFSLFLICCDTKLTNPIEGTWELISGMYISDDNDENAEYRSFNYPYSNYGKYWKIISKTHFATIFQDTTNNSLFSTGFNAGTYTLIDGIYTENFTHSSYIKELIGMKLLFKVKIEGDKLFISSCYEDGTTKDYGNFEEYKRLD